MDRGGGEGVRHVSARSSYPWAQTANEQSRVTRAPIQHGVILFGTSIAASLRATLSAYLA